MTARLTDRQREPLDQTGEEPDARFTWANERTFLAWARTSLALIGGGLVAAQVLHGRFGGWRLLVALPAIVLGALVGFASYRRWEANERALRLGRPVERSPLTRMLTAGIVILALLSAALVVIAAATR
jgi:putative membrane protein